MTVQELISVLEKVEDKKKIVVFDYDADFQVVEDIEEVHGEIWDDEARGSVRRALVEIK